MNIRERVGTGTQAHGIAAHSIALDLADPDAPRHVFDELYKRNLAVNSSTSWTRLAVVAARRTGGGEDVSLTARDVSRRTQSGLITVSMA